MKGAFMKKKLFLLPIALLLLGGCSKTDGDDGGSISLDQAVTLLTQATEFKAKYQFTMAGEGEFWGLGMAIPSYTERVIKSLAVVKGKSIKQDANDGSMYLKYNMKISDLVASTGLTIEELEAMLENPIYSQHIKEYEVDKPNDSCWFTMEEDFMEPNTVMYSDYRESDGQARYATFFNNRLINSGYLEPGLYSDDEFLAVMEPLLTELKAKSSNLTEEDGKYVLDLSSDPLDVGYGAFITRLAFKYTNTNFILDFTEITSYSYVAETVYGTYEFYDLGQSGFTMPEFEVFCPYNHASTRYFSLNENQHVKVCTHCDKIVGNPENHTKDNVHDLCHLCETNRRDSSFEDVSKKLSNQRSYFDAYKRNNMYYNMHLNSNFATARVDYNFEDEGIHGDAFYFGAPDNILAFQYEMSGRTPFGTCHELYNEKAYIFRNVELVFSEAEQAILNGNDYGAKYNLYTEKLNLPSTLAELKTRYSTYEEYTSYEFTDNHDMTPVVVHAGTCVEATYYRCETCGECYGGSIDVYHDFDLTVVHPQPEWNHSQHDVVCSLGTCSKCGEDRHGEYALINVYPNHEDYCYIDDYDADGNRHDGFYNFVPHIDNDGDNHCDICGAVKLTTTYDNVSYSIYVLEKDVVSGPSIWTYKSWIDPIEGDDVVEYNYRSNNYIDCHVRFHIDEEAHTIVYKFKIICGGQESEEYVSPAYPYQVPEIH